ncbi:MAG: hypothetical protein ACMZI0_16060 [Symbiopectobacterium sp.]|uniref:hypothetical protein n=1 Tax=Symbiopectobacterium sp. TaxID=2952789 RepID=UPI0039EB7005
MIELENPAVKEILSFMLAERLEHLHVSLGAPYSHDDELCVSSHKTSGEDGGASVVASK